jgi:hypothetical protein
VVSSLIPVGVRLKVWIAATSGSIWRKKIDTIRHVTAAATVHVEAADAVDKIVINTSDAGAEHLFAAFIHSYPFPFRLPLLSNLSIVDGVRADAGVGK